MRFLLKINKKRILVTGASGFIGGHLVARFKEGHDIVAPNFSELDLTNKNMAVAYSESLGKIDMVIHLASRLITTGEADDMSVLYDNIKIAENTALITSRAECVKFINFSSMAVYPNVSGEFTETSPTGTSGNTECIYGLSKICTENLFDHFLKEKGVSVIHLRMAQVYGEGIREDRIIPIMMRELKDTNNITVFGDGERVSNFIHIDEVIEAVEMFVKEDVTGIYNLGDEQLSYFELAEKVIREHGNESSKIIKKSKGTRAKFILDISKLNKFRSGSMKR